MISIPKLRIQFGPNGPIRIYSVKENSAAEFSFHYTEQSKKRGSNELKDGQVKKKQKLDGDWSIQCSTPRKPSKQNSKVSARCYQVKTDLITSKKKRGPNELKDVEANKMKNQKPNCVQTKPSKHNSKGSAKKVACKCGRIICICHKSSNEVSSLTDCIQAKKKKKQKLDCDWFIQCSAPTKPSKQKSKGSARTVGSKCGSCGGIICICLKSCNSSLTDCQVKKTSCAPQSNNELGATDFPDIPPTKSLRTAILKAQIILKVKHEEEEKARRIEAEMKAAKIEAKKRAQADLKQKREKQRLELAQMEKSCNLEENNYRKVEKDFLNVCDRTSLREIRRYVEEKLGLVLKNDEVLELEEDIYDLEEGEIH